MNNWEYLSKNHQVNIYISYNRLISIQDWKKLLSAMGNKTNSKKLKILGHVDSSHTLWKNARHLFSSAKMAPRAGVCIHYIHFYFSSLQEANTVTHWSI